MITIRYYKYTASKSKHIIVNIYTFVVFRLLQKEFLCSFCHRNCVVALHAGKNPKWKKTHYFLFTPFFIVVIVAVVVLLHCFLFSIARSHTIHDLDSLKVLYSTCKRLTNRVKKRKTRISFFTAVSVAFVYNTDEFVCCVFKKEKKTGCVLCLCVMEFHCAKMCWTTYFSITFVSYLYFSFLKEIAAALHINYCLNV